MNDTSDEVLLTKFLMCGGYFWDCGFKPRRWFAIEPGCNEGTPCHNVSGTTPAKAVRKFIEEFGAPWEKNYKSLASTAIAAGPTPPPTA